MKMAGCNQDFFVVARDSVFEFVLMENTGIKAEFMDHDANRYISRTIHDPTYIAWRMRRMQFVKDNIPKRLPNGQFKLKDHIGNEVLDGERFRLTVDIERYHAHYAGEHRNDEDPEYKGVDLSPGFLMMYPGDDSIFTSETIDGIVFLKYGEEYVYCPDDDGRVIKTSQELPEKNQRLQLEYDEGVLFLSRWDRFGYACEDWLDHRGYIRFENEDGDYSNDPRLELRLVKIQ
ncbi:hypothetical protein FBU59_007117 [Linderina macrospora]|uniref:Uncharacterized protein n=1 Tax=Linderina macrospora TaxID=4868 RepID=A0ACC1IXZ5_9FUNG|nr:hypothetical protein FBU59_007117 [Linderina macrospora]